MNSEFEKIQKLVGPVTKEEARYVDCFVSDNVGVFIPVGGACYYALTPMHTHPSYMAVISFNNDTSFKIGNKTITAEQGKMFFLSPEIPHQELPSDFPPRYIAVFIDKFFFNNQFKHYKTDSKKTFKGKYYKLNPELLLLIKRFMAEADKKIFGYKSLLEALSIEIAHSIIRAVVDVSYSHEKISDRIEIDNVISYMHINIDKKITIQELANIACMSVSHFSRIFKKETDFSPLDYLKEIRLKQAKKLLSAGDKTITEIAYDCGFSSSAYLSSSFQKKFNTTPSAYQKYLKK